MDEIQRLCPDCQQPLQRIRMIDATAPLGLDDWGGAKHVTLQYSAADAPRKGIFLARFPVAGHVFGWLCDQCGRVQLYAAPIPPSSNEGIPDADHAG